MATRRKAGIRWAALLAACLAALALGHGAGLAQERAGGVFGQRAEGLPELGPEQVDALREHLGLSRDRKGRAGDHGKLGALKKKLQEKVSAEDAARSAKQAPLGVPKVLGKVGAPSVLVPNSRWLGEVSDLADVPGFERAKAQRGGAVWHAWVTKDHDVAREATRPRKAWKGPQGIPKTYRLNELPTDWRGLFSKTSTGGLENGMTRGHIIPNSDATFSKADQRRTFQVYANAFPQSRDSNAGAWRNLEKTLQEVARGPEYNVYNYAGVLWQPHEYTRMDGTKAVVRPEFLEGGIPKPTAYWRVAIAVPTRGPDGKTLDLADGLSRARPIAVVVPNAQDAEIFVSDWSRFSTSIAEVEKLAGLDLFTSLEGAPEGERIVQALRQHVDDGKDLPREQGMPEWKVRQVKELIEKGGSVSEHAVQMARELLRGSDAGAGKQKKKPAQMRERAARKRKKASGGRATSKARWFASQDARRRSKQSRRRAGKKRSSKARSFKTGRRSSSRQRGTTGKPRQRARR